MKHIDADAHTLTAAASADQRERKLGYDKLILATGAEPVRPPIPGIDREGVFQLHTIGDSLVLQEALARGPASAVIVGAGYIRLEMAEALRARGLGVTIVEQVSTVLPTVDSELGALVRDELERNGVVVEEGVTITAIAENGGKPLVLGEPDFGVEADVVLVVVGVKPTVGLGQTAGITTGSHGALLVNRRMETNLSDVFAAGDCVATYHRLLEADTYLPLGTTAHKQGRIAGENAVGGDRSFQGSLGTQVVKVFELAVARTGLCDDEARAAGWEPLTVESRGYDHKIYYPGAEEITARLTGDLNSGQLLGAQLVGRLAAQVPKRIDISAGALFQRLTVDTLNDLDLSYAPPFGSPWDVMQTAAQEWSSVAVHARP